MSVEVNAPIDELHEACRQARLWIRVQHAEARWRLNIDGFDIGPIPDEFR